MFEFRKNPVVSYIGVVAITLILEMILSGIIATVFNINETEPMAFIVVIVTTLIIAALYIYKFKFKTMFALSNFKLGIILVLPFVLFILANFLDSDLIIPPTLTLLGLCVLKGLAPGLSEEIIFRGIFVSYMMKVFKSPKKIIGAALIPAVLFGLIHVANVFVGAPLDVSIFQAVYAFGVGVLFSAVYLRTGNLWVPIIMHTIADFVAFCHASMMEGMGVLSGSLVLDLPTVYMLIVIVIVIAFGLYYIRPAKHDEILELWEEKWSLN